MAELDLNAYIAEHEAEIHKVVLGPTTYELPAKMPLVVGKYAADGDIRGVVSVLFGPGAVDEVAPMMTYDQETGEGTLGAIMHDLYGVPLPESSASSSSSNGTGTRSRPTSKGSTTGS